MPENKVSVKTAGFPEAAPAGTSSRRGKKAAYMVFAVLAVAAGIAAYILFAGKEPAPQPAAETNKNQEEAAAQTDYRHLILQQSKVIVPRITKAESLDAAQLPQEVRALIPKGAAETRAESLVFYNGKTGYRVSARTAFSGADAVTGELRTANLQNKDLELLYAGYNDGAGLLEYQSSKWEIQILLTGKDSPKTQDYALTVIRK